MDERMHYAPDADGGVRSLTPREFRAHIARLDPNEGYRDAIAFDREYAQWTAPLHTRAVA